MIRMTETQLNPYFGSTLKRRADALGQLIGIIRETKPRTPVKAPEKMLLGDNHEAVMQYFRTNTATNKSELRELIEAIDGKNPAEILDEYGDVLWSVINWGLKLGIDIKEALRKVLIKTLARLNTATDLANQESIALSPDMNIPKWKSIWNKAKEYLSTRKNEWETIARKGLATV